MAREQRGHRGGRHSAGVLGLRYSQFTPYGFNGSFVYGKLTYRM